jgi:hypothetical protein
MGKIRTNWQGKKVPDLPSSTGRAFLNQQGTGGRSGQGCGQAWAGKSLENVGKSLISYWNPRKWCEYRIA